MRKPNGQDFEQLQLAVMFLLLAINQNERAKWPNIYRTLETLSLMRNNLLPVISPEHMMSFSRVYASELGERREA